MADRSPARESLALNHSPWPVTTRSTASRAQPRGRPSLAAGLATGDLLGPSRKTGQVRRLRNQVLARLTGRVAPMTTQAANPGQTCRSLGSPHRLVGFGTKKPPALPNLAIVCIKATPLRGATGRAIAPGLSLGEARPDARPAPRPQPAADRPWHIRLTPRCCTLPSSSALQYPARGRRVKSARCARVACDRLRRFSTRRPLARDRRLLVGRRTGLGRADLARPFGAR